MRDYLSAELEQGHVQLSEKRYGMIPVVAAGRSVRTAAAELGFAMQQTALRYRNPDNKPDAFEKRVLQRLQDAPPGKHHAEVVYSNGNPIYRYIQTFRAGKSCLKCHGDPQQAPKFIRERFPPSKDASYGYKLGEPIGAVSMQIPLNVLFGRVQRNLGRELGMTAAIFAGLLLVLVAVLRSALLVPLRRLADVMQHILASGRFDRRLPVSRQDEAGLLMRSFNALMDRLQQKEQEDTASESRFRELAEGAPDALVAFLANGQIIFFNRQAEELLQVRRYELLGSHFAQLFPELESLVQNMETWKRRLVLWQEQPTLLQTVAGPVEMTMSPVASSDETYYCALLRPRRP